MTDDTTTAGPGDAADLHALTGAYALDALDDLERRTFERHLAGCAACRDEVRGFRETAARLADGVTLAPPSGMRDRVLAEVRQTPQLPPLQRDGDQQDAAPAGRRTGRAPRRSAGRPPAPGRTWAAAAAVAAVLALGGGTFGAVEWRAAQDARARQDAAVAREQRIATVLADPARRLVSAPVSSGGTVTLAVAGDRAVVLTAGVPGLPADRTYQLWVVRSDGISSLGLGPAAAEAAGSWARPVDGIRPGDTVAVSVEPQGGSQQPTTEPVAAVKV